MINWRDITDEKEKYHAYLCSPEWWAKRQQVIERCGNRCEECHRRSVTEVHHRTYIRKYREHLSDLVGLCGPCHEAIHKPPVGVAPRQGPSRDEMVRHAVANVARLLCRAPTPKDKTAEIIRLVTVMQWNASRRDKRVFMPLGWIHPAKDETQEQEWLRTRTNLAITDKHFRRRKSSTQWIEAAIAKSTEDMKRLGIPLPQRPVISE